MIFVLFISALFVQQIYHLFVFSRIAFHKSPASSTESKHFVSVVICCKNEINNLKVLLPILAQQSYKSTHFVFVDDQSNDASADFIQAFSEAHSEMDILYLPVKKSIAGKKELVYLGVQAAKGPYILVTDADCRPASNHWIENMLLSLTPNKSIVLGYAPFNKVKGSVVNLFARFENFITGAFYLSFAMNDRPYMGVGRNMLFKQALYLETYEAIKAVDSISGDDDLFIQFAATPQNTCVNMHPSTFCFSDAKQSWSAFFAQKARHIQTGFHYQKAQLIALALYPASLAILYLAYVSIAVFNSDLLIFASLILLIHFALVSFIKGEAAKILGFQSKCPLLVLDIFFLLYQIILLILPFKRNKTQW